MINYKDLCEQTIADPPFSNANKSHALFALTRMEIQAYKKHEEVHLADNEKWHELWMAMKEAIYDFRTRMIGCRQFQDLIAPIKHEIIGRTQ